MRPGPKEGPARASGGADNSAMISPVSILPLSAAILSAALIVTAGLASRRRTLAGIFFLALNTATMLWSLAYFLQLNWGNYEDPALARFASPDYVLLWITALGVGGAPTYWFLFSAATARNRFWTSGTGIALANVPFLYTIAVAVSNPMHRLFLAGTAGGRKVDGPLAWPHYFFTYVLVLAGIYLLIRGAAAPGTVAAKRRAIAVGAVASLPLLGGLIYTQRLLAGDPLPINPVPVLFPVLNLMLAYQVMRGELGDIVPLSTLTSLMEHTDANLAYMDREYTMISANSAFIRRSGHSESEVVGRGYFDVFADGQRRGVFDRVRDTGEPAEGQAETGWFLESDPRSLTYWNSLLSPVFDQTGELTGLVLSLMDVSEAVRERELADEVNVLSARLHAGFSSEAVIREVVAEAGEALRCDSCSIVIQDDEQWSVMQHCERPDASWETLAEDDVPHIALALRTKTTVEVRDALTDERVNPSMMRVLEVRAALVVPLMLAGDSVGALSFEMGAKPTSFSRVQIEFACRLAQAVSLAYENNRLYQAEHRIAETLQESLLTVPRSMPGIEFAHIYLSATETARVGGDFYDLFETEGERIAVLVGDVSGKGIEAAVVTSLVKNTVRATAYHDRSPASIIRSTNEIVRRQTESDVFATAFLGILENATGRFTYANAGHPPGMVLARRGRIGMLEEHSTILGAFPDMEFADAETTLAPDDVLLLYTDGVTEARSDGDLFGIEGLLDALSPLGGLGPQQVVDDVFSRVLAYTGADLSDDAVLLALRRDVGDAVATRSRAARD